MSTAATVEAAPSAVCGGDASHKVRRGVGLCTKQHDQIQVQSILLLIVILLYCNTVKIIFLKSNTHFRIILYTNLKSNK
jgi:hypothetical protein